MQKFSIYTRKLKESTITLRPNIEQKKYAILHNFALKTNTQKYVQETLKS